jgi:hypothetical protein
MPEKFCVNDSYRAFYSSFFTINKYTTAPQQKHNKYIV